MWTVEYRGRYGMAEMVIKADTRELAEETFMFNRLSHDEFGVIVRVTPFEGEAVLT